MQIHRLFGIVHLLLDQRQTTADALAEHFEVSKRTILRDVQTLISAGIPLYTLQGKGGGIAIIDSYVLDKTTLTDAEQEQILLSLQSVAATGQVESDDVLAKLGRLFQKSDQEWIEVDFTRWGSSEPDRQRFSLIKQAILEHLQLSLTYVGTSGSTTSRQICPLKLVFKSQSWFLVGFCLLRGDYRTFKVNRIIGLELSGEAFEADDYTAPPIEPSEATSGVLANLELRFAPQVLHRVYDEFDETQVERLEDGSAVVKVRLPHDEWLYGFLMSFGLNVSVVKPESIRLRLLGHIEDIALKLNRDG